MEYKERQNAVRSARDQADLSLISSFGARAAGGLTVIGGGIISQLFGHAKSDGQELVLFILMGLLLIYFLSSIKYVPNYKRSVTMDFTKVETYHTPGLTITLLFFRKYLSFDLNSELSHWKSLTESEIQQEIEFKARDVILKRHRRK